MRKFKFMMPALAAIIAVIVVFSASAFKTSAKTTEDPLHWYEVYYDANNPNGVILDGTTSYKGFYTRSNVPNSCSGDTKDCLRGFEEQLPEEEFETPLPDSGDEQILRD